MAMTKETQIALKNIREHSFRLNEVVAGYAGPRRAGILVPIFINEDGELDVLLTVRSSNLGSHSSEVSCPGGKFDSADSDIVETALREAEEEVGLSRDEVSILNSIHPTVSRNILIVSPVIGLIPSDFIGRASPNPSEVDRVFSISLKSIFQNHDHTHVDMNWLNEPWRMHSFQRSNERVWGLTANVILRVAEIAFSGTQVKCEFHVRMPGQPIEDVSIRFDDFLANVNKAEEL
ncbi:hypothetical protein SmJEL517_g05637 [Synchytrium microbalum]|uniref:Nudix hydrolase domain-containing protein n=1 Tax=Synchytrium microbalum TaxID=1806994 RepID=A0A507BV72_9FUNG|nr:uncharacterized protein SmJEL517_g05637 [Synchytrium microbalum]TPX30859.1 hypothetical protein SmJEL517_g05637 [Synchytrium microbalum]